MIGLEKAPTSPDLSDPNRSDSNRKSLATAIASQKKSLQLRKTPSEANSLDSGSTSFASFFIVFQKRHTGQETFQKSLRLHCQGCDSESQRFFWPNAVKTAISVQFLREKLATSKLRLAIA